MTHDALFLSKEVYSLARNKKETIQFTKNITAGQTLSGITSLRQQIRSPGTIQRIFGKFYVGQQGALQVRPYLDMYGTRDEELITYPQGMNKFLSGDDIVFDFNVDFEVLPDYEIRIDVSNTSAFDYTLQISFEVDYVGGTARVV